MDPFGRYEVREVLGRGDHVVTYKAWDPLLERTLAIRVLTHPTFDEEAKQRFFIEARQVARRCRDSVDMRAWRLPESGSEHGGAVDRHIDRPRAVELIAHVGPHPPRALAGREEGEGGIVGERIRQRLGGAGEVRWPGRTDEGCGHSRSPCAR